jgi:DNA-binding MarR family transcriptional regulator
MPLPRNPDATDLVILRAIAERPEILTREVEVQAYLSRTQTLRRLQRLEQEGLIAKRNGRSKAYSYTLNPDVDIEQLHQKLNVNRDPVAREALKIMLQAMEQIINVLADATERIESILK